MKIALIFFLLAWNYTYGQTMTSYKFEKGHENGTTLFAGRFIQSYKRDYIKIKKTIITIDTTARTITIGKKTWKLIKSDNYNYIGYHNMEHCEIHLIPLTGYHDISSDNQIRIDLDKGISYTYYIKPNNWKIP
jgi:hypothetical protein